MSVSRISAGLVSGLVILMFAAGLSLKTYAEDESEAEHNRQDRAKIKEETQEIQMGKQKIIQDNRLIKADRVKVRDARLSGNKANIEAAKTALRDDIARKKTDISELKRNKIQRCKDISDLNRDLKGQKHQPSRY